MYVFQEKPGPGTYKVKRDFDTTTSTPAPDKLKFTDCLVPLHPPFLTKAKVCRANYTVILVIVMFVYCTSLTDCKLTL